MRRARESRRSRARQRPPHAAPQGTSDPPFIQIHLQIHLQIYHAAAGTWSSKCFLILSRCLAYSIAILVALQAMKMKSVSSGAVSLQLVSLPMVSLDASILQQ